MPFDGLPEGLVTDLVKLRIALDGVRGGKWTAHHVGLKPDDEHCAIGWLLVATEGDRDEATRLALEYVYPALPEPAQKRERLKSIWQYNDAGGRKRIERLFTEASRLAELRAAR
jgi:ferric-dicitrate binding protein FerR (iron transport regulator)